MRVLCTTLLALAAAAIPLLAAARLGRGPGGPDPGSASVTSVTADVASRPSHHGLYRAAVVASDPPVRPGRVTEWTIRVRTAEGPVRRDAVVAAELRSLDDGREAVPLVVRTGSPGEFAIGGIRIGGAGWWSLALTIRSALGTDSLAFNVIVDDVTRVRRSGRRSLRNTAPSGGAVSGAGNDTLPAAYPSVTSRNPSSMTTAPSSRCRTCDSPKTE